MKSTFKYNNRLKARHELLDDLPRPAGRLDHEPFRCDLVQERGELVDRFAFVPGREHVESRVNARKRQSSQIGELIAKYRSVST